MEPKQRLGQRSHALPRSDEGGSARLLRPLPLGGENPHPRSKLSPAPNSERGLGSNSLQLSRQSPTPELAVLALALALILSPGLDGALTTGTRSALIWKATFLDLARFCEFRGQSSPISFQVHVVSAKGDLWLPVGFGGRGRIRVESYVQVLHSCAVCHGCQLLVGSLIFSANSISVMRILAASSRPAL